MPEKIQLFNKALWGFWWGARFLLGFLVGSHCTPKWEWTFLDLTFVVFYQHWSLFW